MVETKKLFRPFCNKLEIIEAMWKQGICPMRRNWVQIDLSQWEELLWDKLCHGQPFKTRSKKTAGNHKWLKLKLMATIIIFKETPSMPTCNLSRQLRTSRSILNLTCPGQTANQSQLVRLYKTSIMKAVLICAQRCKQSCSRASWTMVDQLML